MHTLNLYRPLGADGSLPVIVDIHGGGWMYGDRELNQAYCMYLASQGWAVMGMSYRLLPEVDLREQIQDVFASFHWLERHAGTYGLDLDRLCLTGDSAGGHLAGWPPVSSWTPPSRSCTEPSPWPTPSGPWPSPTGYAMSTASTFSSPIWTGQSPGNTCGCCRPRWPLLPLWGHASFEDTAPGCPFPHPGHRQ